MSYRGRRCPSIGLEARCEHRPTVRPQHPDFALARVIDSHRRAQGTAQGVVPLEEGRLATAALGGRGRPWQVAEAG
jgi:hypothetical protein